MSARTPADRALVARIAASTRWAHESDRTAATKPARDARFQRYLDQIDPSLPEAERVARAELLRRADMQRLALKSAQVRRSRGAVSPR